MPERTNSDRAEDAALAVDFYSSLLPDDEGNESPTSVTEDFLTDMMHLARLKNLDFEQILRMADQHYEWEMEEDLDDPDDDAPPGADHSSVKDWSPKRKGEEAEEVERREFLPSTRRGDASRAAEALEYFGSNVYGSPEEEPLDQTMYDLIANMKHSARFDEEDWEWMMRRALRHFAEDVAMEG